MSEPSNPMGAYGPNPGPAMPQQPTYGNQPGGPAHHGHAPAAQPGQPAWDARAPQAPGGYGATPPPVPKKGLPLSALIAIPVALLLILAGVALGLLRPWETKRAAPSSPTSAATSTTPTQPSSTRPTSPSSPASSRPASPSVSSAKPSSPISPKSPSSSASAPIQPVSTKPHDQVVLPQQIGEYTFKRENPGSMTVYKSWSYSKPGDSAELLVMIVKPGTRSIDIVNGTASNHKDFQWYGNYGCGIFLSSPQCTADIAAPSTITLSHRKLTVDEHRALMADLVTKIA